MRQHHHHTDNEVERFLSDAVALVERLDVPDDLRVSAFQKACDLLSSKQVFYTQEDAAPLNAGVMLDPRVAGH